MAIAFVPEDGTGLSTANSYMSVDRFKEISDFFGYDYSDLTDTQIEQNLSSSTFLIDSDFRTRFPGIRAVEGQALEWPRENATYIDGEEIDEAIVPYEVERATVEMVYASIAGASLQPVLSPTGNIKEESIKVDVIEEKKKYDTQSTYRRDLVTKVEDALSRITGGVGSLYQLRIIRVGG